MKQHWLKLAKWVDARNLRERVLISAMVAAVLVALLNVLLIDPLRTKQANLVRQVAQDEGKIAAIHAQMQALIQASNIDPNAVSRARLPLLKQQLAQMDETLRGMQKGLVPPDRMAALLGDILRHEGQLQLVSLKTLPASSIIESMEPKADSVAAQPEAKKAGAALAVPDGPLVYKHGVELVVKGNYSSLLHYLARLESSPWQMFWGKAELRVEGYPTGTLFLTLYTLSLDKAWLSI